MKTVPVVIGLLVLFLIGLMCNPVYGKSKMKVITKGETLPPLTLESPESSEAKEYLGLEEGSSFSISQIPAKFVLLEVINVR